MENAKHRILIYLNIEEYLWGFCFFSPALKHTTGNMVTEPRDRFVCMAYMSQQPALISPSTMLCLGVHCPLITWLGERREGKVWEWVCASVCSGGFLDSGRLWTAGPPVRVSPHSEAEISATENRG